MTDSIIDEVRAIREQHAASFGFDLDRIYADLQARQIKHAAEGWVDDNSRSGHSATRA